MAFYNKLKNNSNFVVSFSNFPQKDFACFAKGYANAARNISKYLISKNHFPDYEAYPVVFLYRHSFELYLKGIIYEASRFASLKNIDEYQRRLINNHDLKDLARIARNVICSCFPEDTKLDRLMDKCKLISNEFSDIDPDSYSYRYPINRCGDESTIHHQVVNLRSVYQEMDLILEDLDTVAYGLDMEISNVEEWIDQFN